jgi:hypothetical protein
MNTEPLSLPSSFTARCLVQKRVPFRLHQATGSTVGFIAASFQRPIKPIVSGVSGTWVLGSNGAENRFKQLLQGLGPGFSTAAIHPE